MKKLLLLSLLAVCLSNVLPQDLPHKLTDTEKQLLQNYLPPKSQSGFTTPPASPVRTMAEWEELEGLLIAWTSYTSILRQIVKYAQTECLVYIVCSDSASVKTYLQSGGVPLTNVKFAVAAFNSVWCRDYGPWSVYSNNADSMYIVDWIYNRPRPNDDLVPAAFANQQGIPLYQTTTSPYNLIHTGGNFMTDGQGTGFSSKLVLTENPSQTAANIDTIMKKFMGIKRYVKMETLPYDQIHHIDMHMKLLDEETLLVGQYPAGVADGPQIEANLQYILANYKTCYGRDYKVVRIPMPPDAQGRYPSNSGDYRTYTNSSIVNKTVIVPTYEVKHDTTALRIYREAMPGYTVVGIDCNQTITSLGAIHCITKEIGVRELVYISHAPIRSLLGMAQPYQVKAYISSRSGISSASLWWSTDTTAGFHQLPMSYAGADTFTAQLPAQTLGTKLFYYISATSNSGRTIAKPLTARKGAWSFTVDRAVAAQITLLSPNGGENWAAGSAQVIRWSSSIVDSIRIEYTTNNGNQWQVVAASNPAVTGMFTWNIPTVLTTQAKVRLTSVNNTAIFDVSDSLFTIANPCGTVSVTDGWNLIALPVKTTDTVVTTLFPQAVSPAYAFANTYQISSSITPGRGYWLKFAAPYSGTFCGTAPTAPITVSAGWNLIGVYQDSLATAQIVSNPPGIINSQFYSYTNGYAPATTLRGGKGYWVRTTQSGTLQTAIGTVDTRKANPGMQTPEAVTTLQFQDNRQHSAVLLLSQNPEPPHQFDLPPAGPAGTFDVRFSTQRYQENISNGVLTASVTGAEYPVTITCSGQAVQLQDKATGGKIFSRVLVNGTRVAVSNTAVQEIEIVPVAKPLSFGLEKNFPNPFNPATTLRYSLATPAQVSICLYNALGQLVQVLVQEDKPAGSYQVTCNAENLSSGIYFVQMRAGDFSQTRKILLVK